MSRSSWIVRWVTKVSVYGAFTKKLVDFNAVTAKKLGVKFPFEYNPIISGYSKNAKWKLNQSP